MVPELPDDLCVDIIFIYLYTAGKRVVLALSPWCVASDDAAPVDFHKNAIR